MSVEKILVAPRLCFYKSEDSENLYAGNGNLLEVYSFKTNSWVRMDFRKILPDGVSIHGTEKIPSTDCFIVYGEKSIAILNERWNDVLNVELDDWISNVKAYSYNSIVVLFGNCLVVVYSFEHKELKEKMRVYLDIKANILSGIIVGENWNDSLVLVGTAFGPIYGFYPERSQKIAKKFEAHKGMIFGLYVKGNFLYSISDDRSLRVWSIDTQECLSFVYGHSARPYALQVVNNYIYTGGSDEEVCLWLLGADNSVNLVKKVKIAGGAIRSLCPLKDDLLIGTECGALVSLLNLLTPLNNRPAINLASEIRAFCCTHNGKLLINSLGEVYFKKAASNNSSHYIWKDEEIRFNTLNNSPGLFYTAFTSDRTLYVFSAYHNFYRTLPLTGVPIALLWVNDGFLLLQTLAGDLLHFCIMSGNIQQMNTPGTIEGDVTITTVCEVSEDDDYLFLGTSKGQILVYLKSRLQLLHRIHKAHKNKPITDLKLFENFLYSIGRDGYISCWSISHTKPFLTLISRRQILEWPSKLMIHRYDCENRLYVAGFHGIEFRLVDVATKLELCKIDCGGGHRQYQIELHGTKVIFHFLHKGLLKCAETSLVYTRNIVGPFHTGQITCCGIMNYCKMGMVLFTGGIDTRFVCTKVEENGLLSPFFSSTQHLSSIHDLDFDEHTIVTVGGRAELICWRFVDNEVRKNEILRNIISIQFGDDFRLVSVRICRLAYNLDDGRNYNEKEVEFVESCYLILIVCSDGTLRGVIFDCSTIEIVPLFRIEPEHLSMLMKSELFGNKIYAISTSGMLYKYVYLLNGKDFPAEVVKIAEIRIENCGLSALDIIKPKVVNSKLSSPEVNCAFIGSESGKVSIVDLISNKIIAVYCYHSSTITSIKAFSIMGPRNTVHYDILTISLDCRLAMHKFSHESNSVSFERAIMLNVSDPASFHCSKKENDSESHYQVAIVGSGIEIINF